MEIPLRDFLEKPITEAVDRLLDGVEDEEERRVIEETLLETYLEIRRLYEDIYGPGEEELVERATRLTMLKLMLASSLVRAELRLPYEDDIDNQ